jgi:uncharacterized protein involved in exopolysaccharide biosynthesis
MDKKLQNMAETKDTDIIDLGKLIRKVWDKRKLFFFKIWPITFVLSCLIIICVPRYYVSEAKLAPELGANMAGGTVGSLASSFGIDLGSLSDNADAISPLLYPDLMEDNGFVTKLFTVRVKSADGNIDTDYYDYLKSHQKSAWWSNVRRWISRSIKSISSSKKPGASTGNDEKSPYWLSEEENGLAEKVRGNIHFTVDKQTAVITITTKAQDPLVAKILADSVQQHLQEFITIYRTNKSRVDEKHYQELYNQAVVAYEKSCNEYARLSDSYNNVVLNRYQMKIDNQEKDMELKYVTLQTISSQLQVAQSKVQERTPAFTVIKGACVTQKPAGPKRMMFVIGMLILVTFVSLLLIVRKDLHIF